ncbi:MAG: EAL domain-containing protein [Treponema sp.]|nr:EAL domain-containing protein [Treponema sp.]
MEGKSSTKKPMILIAGHSVEDTRTLKEIASDSFKIAVATTVEQSLVLLQDTSHQFSGAILYEDTALSYLKEIRMAPSLEDFPILVTMDSSNHSLENELFEYDVIDILKKPFNARRTFNRLKNLVKISNANHLIYELERDELTGLYTRQAFLHKAEKTRNENPNKKFCVMAFDFDNFKSSNTLYGEEKCNEFLSYTAQQLKRVLPKGIVGRYGGDQYVLFFAYDGEKVDVQRVEALTQSILSAAPIPHQVVKIGVNAPISKTNPMLICCDRAFLAIREIKGIYGKNIAFYENKLQKQLLDDKRIIESMEQSLEKGDFKVFYQPKHETITGKLVGAEALVRWEHNEYGFMSPAQFIPLFEKNGFITKLDFYVLEQVCKDLQRWEKLGILLVPISVNVSRHDFLEPGLLTKQLEIIDRYNISHSLLHMEVTESLYSENTEVIISQVKKIQEMGFMIEMDDFGSGYSSLGLLSSFPLNILKLDISFVRNLKTNEVVIENIIKMAHKLGLLTVAEGAETDEQVTTLKTLGCDFIQGYYYSKPLSLAAFEEYLNKAKLDKKRIHIQELQGEDEANDADWHMGENMLIAANEVAEGVPGGFFSYHADGDMELISFNHELMNILGCKSAEEVRQYTSNSFDGIINKEDKEYILKSINYQLASGNDIVFIEYRVRAKDNSIRYLRHYGRFVKTKKYGDIFYVFVNDATEQERWKINAELHAVKEEEMERTVNLAKVANHAKNIFISNIVLELLPDIKAIIDVTNEIYKKNQNNKSIKSEIEIARKSEEHLLSFVNNLHNLSDLESGKIVLIENPSDLTDATKKITSMVEDTAKAKGVKLESWSEIYHPYIYQDLIHTTDVVLNIVQNAVKYTPKGGTVKFGIRQTPSKKKDECIVEFICEDNGIGISKEFLPYICKPFAREDNKINQENPGAGLGLHLAKELLKMMKGTIEIKSQQGKGTTVITSQPHKLTTKNKLKTDTVLSQNIR